MAMDYQPAELENYPGYHIRRLQQIAVAVFMEETQEFGVTPVQYAALSAVLRQPGMDQRTLARQMFSSIRENISPAIAAAAFLFIVGTLLIAAIAMLVRRRTEKMKQPAEA
jgi:asparagine N-glycosylation enzyme membrane subunit Stt3